MIPDDCKAMFTGGSLFFMGTAGADGTPNVAPMLQAWWADETTLVIGDMMMKATAANARETGKVCLSAYDADSDKAYKLLGTAVYETEGPRFDTAQAELVKTKPDKRFKGVVVVTVNAVYDQTRGPNAGALVAEVD
ncbi:MAG: pyridoxamine 5'-phosphate oxidase family protein [Phycisphaerae bacterium]